MLLKIRCTRTATAPTGRHLLQNLRGGQSTRAGSESPKQLFFAGATVQLWRDHGSYPRVEHRKLGTPVQIVDLVRVVFPRRFKFIYPRPRVGGQREVEEGSISCKEMQHKWRRTAPPCKRSGGGQQEVEEGGAEGLNRGAAATKV